MTDRRSRYAVFITGGFVILAALFFVSYFVVRDRLLASCVMPLPVLFAASGLLSYYRRPTWIFAALFLSSLGDVAGAAGRFLWQIAFFAMAHICYIRYFAVRMRPRKAALPLLLALLAAITVLSVRIVPAVETELRIPVVLYMAVISAMAATTVFYRGAGRVFYIAAAFLFVASDSVIAWNRFVCHLPCATAYIMSTYYLAQAVFVITTVKNNPQ